MDMVFCTIKAMQLPMTDNGNKTNFMEKEFYTMNKLKQVWLHLIIEIGMSWRIIGPNLKGILRQIINKALEDFISPMGIDTKAHSMRTKFGEKGHSTKMMGAKYRDYGYRIN